MYSNCNCVHTYIIVGLEVFSNPNEIFLLVCIKINSYDLFLLLLKNLTMCVHKDIQPKLKQKTQLLIFMRSKKNVNMFSVSKFLHRRERL